MLNEYSPWASAFDLQAMSRVLGFGIFICGCDEGDDEVREGCEKLDLMLTLRSFVKRTNHSFHRGLVCSCFLGECRTIPPAEPILGILGTQSREKCTYVFDFISTMEGRLSLSMAV
jgi:hypothetical protein